MDKRVVEGAGNLSMKKFHHLTDISSGEGDRSTDEKTNQRRKNSINVVSHLTAPQRKMRKKVKKLKLKTTPNKALS